MDWINKMQEERQPVFYLSYGSINIISVSSVQGLRHGLSHTELCERLLPRIVILERQFDSLVSIF